MVFPVWASSDRVMSRLVISRVLSDLPVHLFDGVGDGGDVVLSWTFSFTFHGMSVLGLDGEGAGLRFS